MRLIHDDHTGSNGEPCLAALSSSHNGAISHLFPTIFAPLLTRPYNRPTPGEAPTNQLAGPHTL